MSHKQYDDSKPNKPRMGVSFGFVIESSKNNVYALKIDNKELNYASVSIFFVKIILIKFTKFNIL